MKLRILAVRDSLSAVVLAKSKCGVFALDGQEVCPKRIQILPPRTTGM
jgi:hypothetical protein